MKVKDTMRSGAPGNPVYTKFVQNKVLGEAACWALSLQWIMSTAEGWGPQYLDKVQDDGAFKQLARDDQKELISEAGQDHSKFTKYHQYGLRLKGLRGDGGIELQRFDPRGDRGALFYEDMANGFAGKTKPARDEYFVIANVRFIQRGGLSHAMAGHFHQPGFTYFDPNGGVLRFAFARDFIRWFLGRFRLADEAHYDEIGIAEFDYYIR